MKDMETSKSVEKWGDEKAAYTQTFTESQPLQAEAVSSIYLGDYTNSPGLIGYDIQVNQDDRYFTGSISLAKSMLTKSDFSEEYHVFKLERIIFYLIWAAALAAIFYSLQYGDQAGRYLVAYSMWKSVSTVFCRM